MHNSNTDREPVCVEALTPDECRQFEDMEWALQSPDVLVQYRDQFVVPYMKQIVAHGDDIDALLAEAARITGRRPEELPVVGIVDPLVDVSSG